MDIRSHFGSSNIWAQTVWLSTEDQGERCLLWVLAVEVDRPGVHSDVKMVWSYGWFLATGSQLAVGPPRDEDDLRQSVCAGWALPGPDDVGVSQSEVPVPELCHAHQLQDEVSGVLRQQDPDQERPREALRQEAMGRLSRYPAHGWCANHCHDVDYVPPGCSMTAIVIMCTDRSEGCLQEIGGGCISTFSGGHPWPTAGLLCASSSRWLWAPLLCCCCCCCC